MDMIFFDLLLQKPIVDSIELKFAMIDVYSCISYYLASNSISTLGSIKEPEIDS